MPHKKTVERRQHPRVANNVPVKISCPLADFVTQTQNISCSGTYCRVDKYLEPMTKLGITLLLPIKKSGKVVTKKVACNGVVVRSENIPNNKEFYTAIFFHDIHPKDSQTLAEFVAGMLGGKKSI
ncbi:MAG: PilZ domain-containing protein [Candidatus Omnitrophica bacterium]|nr:PilZ domain-containing protein [Candidatus Omnitrophota bacterium]